MRKLLTFGTVLLALASPTLACSPSEIKIKQADWQPPIGRGPGDDLVRFIGEVTNTCDEGVNVELHFVFRDDAGKVTGAEDDWVSSVNIPPRSDYAFSKVVRAGFDAKTMTVTVEDVVHADR